MWAEALMLFESSSYDYIFNIDDFNEIITYNSRYIKNNSKIKNMSIIICNSVDLVFRNEIKSMIPGEAPVLNDYIE